MTGIPEMPGIPLKMPGILRASVAWPAKMPGILEMATPLLGPPGVRGQILGILCDARDSRLFPRCREILEETLEDSRDSLTSYRGVQAGCFRDLRDAGDVAGFSSPRPGKIPGILGRATRVQAPAHRYSWHPSAGGCQGCFGMLWDSRGPSVHRCVHRYPRDARRSRSQKPRPST